MENDTDEANSEYSDDYSFDNLFDVSSPVFEGVRVVDCINPSLSPSRIFPLALMVKKTFLHKQTAAWLLSKDEATLCTGRLTRVITD